jgi:hypothetical protein
MGFKLEEAPPGSSLLSAGKPVYPCAEVGCAGGSAELIAHSLTRARESLGVLAEDVFYEKKSQR